MTTLIQPHKNGSQVSAPNEAWLRSSVQSFFSGINWDDNPPEVQEIRRTYTEPSRSEEPLSLTLSVCQFFAAINWEGGGGAIAAPPAAPLSTPAATVDDLTLDDFSSLF